MARRPYKNPTPRPLAYYQKHIAHLQRRGWQASDLNLNATTWRWLYSFLYSMYYLRCTSNGRLDSNVVSFSKWLDTTSPRHFNKVTLVVIGHLANKIVVPRPFCKSYYTNANTLVYCSTEKFEYYKQTGDVLWCTVNKNWYASGTFRDYHYLNPETKQVESRYSALPPIFQCSLCDLLWHTDSRQYNKQHAVYCCPKCTSKTLSNRPHTRASVFGEYHSHGRNGWKFFPWVAPKDNTIPMGVELEICYKHYKTQVYNPANEAWALYTEQKAYNNDWHLFYFERDGSLGDCGIEMITQPMSQKLHNEFWNMMLPKIRENYTGWATEPIANNAPYGIHITFEVNRFGPFHVARLTKFLENADNQVFVQAMAQRGVLYGTTETLASKTKTLGQVHVIEKGRFLGSQSRSQAVYVKNGGSLCEIRMFRSTLNTNSFFKNLEFLYAFHEWCLNTPFSTKHQEFLAWLLNNVKTLYPKYQHLYGFLTHENFPVKLAKYTTVNKWRDKFLPLVNEYKAGQRELFASSNTTPPGEDYT